MSTPIEIVRAYLDARVTKWGTQADVDLDCALASVLADAERFKALERAHEMNVKDRSKMNGAVSVSIGYDTGLEHGWKSHNGTLAELADRLRKEA